MSLNSTYQFMKIRYFLFCLNFDRPPCIYTNINRVLKVRIYLCNELIEETAQNANFCNVRVFWLWLQ